MIKTSGGFWEVAAFTGNTASSVSRLVHDCGSVAGVSPLVASTQVLNEVLDAMGTKMKG